ncbi:hypothetical protein KBY88_06185 [Cyanobium sp. Morenito 9A2]|nr:hypothetical protein [Cyanobium sp. Morenito 9A2]
MERSSGERGSGERGGARGGERGGSGREPGGFRIRLSDNELRAAQVVQEAFQLRSTVAALGLSIRTVAQLLEQGQLDALVAQHRAGGGGLNAGGGSGGRPEGGQRRAPRSERGGEGRGERPSSKPNPFARPSRPAPVSEPPQPPAEQPEAEQLEADQPPADSAAEPISSEAESPNEG